MLRELLVRFALGGAIVSAFSVAGELFKPKTFAGLFGAAPSVAIASLALAFQAHGALYAVGEARGACLGSIALGVFALVVTAGGRRLSAPTVLVLASAAWLATAVVLWYARYAKA